MGLRYKFFKVKESLVFPENKREWMKKIAVEDSKCTDGREAALKLNFKGN